MVQTNLENNGGYYAIKGFEFQIDKAILDILDSKEENTFIGIEKIQDIDTSNYVIQVKYRESAKFVPSEIKEPIIQLLNEFKINNTKTYYLYIFFCDLNGYENFVNADKKIKIENLEQILGNNSNEFTKQEKENFIEKFILDFAPAFHDQFNLVIKRIQELSICSNFEEGIFLYSNITDFIRKLVVNNIKPEKRICTKKQIIEYISSGKSLIFNAAFREYKGDSAYYKMIKSQYFSFKNLDKFKRFIIIEIKESDKIFEIEDILFHIKNKFYKKCKTDIKGEAPYIYIVNIKQQNLTQLKKELLSEGCMLKDGYDFQYADFSKKTITEKSTKTNKICIKFLNSKEDLQIVLGEKLGVKKEIYQFYLTSPIEIEHDIQHIKIHIKTIGDIPHIL